MSKTSVLSPGEIRELAVIASVHPVTVERALAGATPRGLAGHRLRAELAKRGLLYLAPHLERVILGGAAEKPGVAEEGK